MEIQFIDLKAQYRAHQGELDAAIHAVLESALFINGPQVRDAETALAAFVGTRHAVGFSSGTEALRAVLMAWEIGPGDEVIVPPFTFIATAEVVAIVGATPVFVEVEPATLNLDPARLEAAITPRTKAIIPVSLYGQCADFDAINAIAAKHGLPVLEDGCQSMGATYQGRRSCSLTSAGVTSFFPAKPLGCFGDGGMVFTDDDNLDERLRIVREHGQAARYRHAMLGMNGRLDTIQAAVLLAKLPHFQDEIDARQRVAATYRQLLEGVVELPTIRAGNLSVYAQFTVRLKERDRVREAMGAAGIPVAVHYPVPLFQQPVFADLGLSRADFPVSEQAAREVLSLPMHPFLTPEQQQRVATALKQAVLGP